MRRVDFLLEKSRLYATPMGGLVVVGSPVGGFVTENGKADDGAVIAIL
jgi:hypothetical protein